MGTSTAPFSYLHTKELWERNGLFLNITLTNNDRTVSAECWLCKHLFSMLMYLVKCSRSCHRRLYMQATKFTENIDLFTSCDEALQRYMDRAKESSDGRVLDQLGYRFLLFVFRFVFGGTRFDCRLRKIPKTWND